MVFKVNNKPPVAEYPFRYETKPISGNITNGAGEAEKRRPALVFHGGNYSVEWADLEFLFHNIS